MKLVEQFKEIMEEYVRPFQTNIPEDVKERRTRECTEWKMNVK